MLLITPLLNSCVPRSLEPYAEKIHVIPDIASVPKSCKFLGEISCSNIHGESTYFSSDQNLELDDINFLKNRGVKLGANIILFKQHENIITKHQSWGPKHHIYSVATHNIKADAYFCSDGVMEKLRLLKFKDYIDDREKQIFIETYSIKKTGVLINEKI